jgi:hypothetical protein
VGFRLPSADQPNLVTAGFKPSLDAILGISSLAGRAGDSSSGTGWVCKLRLVENNPLQSATGSYEIDLIINPEKWVKIWYN